MKGNPFVGFAPWIIFWVLAGPSTWEWAALGAAITAVILAIPSIERGQPKILELTSIVFFGGLAVVSVLVDQSTLGFLEDYAQVISNGMLAVIALGSLLFTPFTEQYARETTPEEYWNSPSFKHINRVLTAVWGLVFLVSALCRVVAEVWPSALLNWIVPIALIVGAIKLTAWYPEWYPEQQARRGQQQPPDPSASRRVR